MEYDGCECNNKKNRIDHVSKNEFYIILSTLEKNLRWSRIVLITKYQLLYGQMVKCGGRTYNNFNKVMFSMENHFINLYGNTVN